MSKSSDSRKTRSGRHPSRRMLLLSSSAIKRQTFYALENPKRGGLCAKIVGYALFALILLNAVVVFVSAQPGLDPVASGVISVFYHISTACFAIEYIARIWISNLAYNDMSSFKARLKYIISPLGLIDLLSFLPNIIAWFVPVSPAFRNAINVLRLVRLLKISRYMRGLRTIGRVVRMRRHEIVASFLVIALLIVVSSVVMYEIEHSAQPNKFNNLLSGIYWAVTTITGTGYGDLVPITPAGRIVGSIIMFLSVALVAIPGGIFSAGFVAEFQNAKLRHIANDVKRHDDDADVKTDGGKIGDRDTDKTSAEDNASNNGADIKSNDGKDHTVDKADKT